MVSEKWLEIDGKQYFYVDGSLFQNTKVDDYELDKNGVRKAKQQQQINKAMGKPG